MLEISKVTPKAPPRYGWMNGQCIPWDQCSLHVSTQAAFFGASLFEGVRAYWNAEREQLYVFRLDEHLRRLEQSAKMLRMKLSMPIADIRQGVLELLRANEFRSDVHLYVASYFGINHDPDPLFPTDDTGVYVTGTAVSRLPLVHTGISACMSSWRRISDDSVPPRIKIGANYQNSRLAQTEARVNGYHTSVLLNSRGKVSETPGACLLMVRDGRVISPPVTADILESVTRKTLMSLSEAELDSPVIERDMDRTELYIAEEVFLCGTIAEILPVTTIDRIQVGDGEVGPVTRRLQELYFGVTSGQLEAYKSWLLPVYE
ncbi:branched-chain amino acid transaminase [Haliangium ochraceum]|uniref:Branched-chain-amino-acid aminotransferase n=1 Tax=Haliangium ochraceum (strain DSM 14365 / JCM 11303 / SMP-2) TaxID=502025 RepID=D0LR31_HALO1|nr:branched-chain amino acid transaminase [Haliangium ochraceum]6H65_A Chain A, Branched-chain-amino-acid aminotransferase [Haliangium ochraceum DSM 14365]6H65_B Chain B, Branched-chain-amino-acid aminotransferase [Haliangium ochraceum DSM 14365]6H65_C Chain C, Branched-chain-amino-acid aminotransferase [Haliangium ochraceum DSM 14365]6H65_D Chain D, Branched-chain-amino-acid aminotransferase [Haliangium ochraceum DSM 14365]6H65_E Chain E, Branched-chain-amino-acid aminotransferase [Haliangium